METEEVFNGLVENACDFVERSVSQFRESPKHSLINFCTGLELFLKARLIVEHWSLIFSRIENADRENFKDGDFISANYENLVARLKKIADTNIPPEANAIFNSMRKNRNKLVHFHHNAFTANDPEEVLGILHDHGQAWWHLYRLLTDKWSEVFKDWQDKIQRLNWRMHQDAEFLSAKWDIIRPLLEQRDDYDSAFVSCKDCGYKSAETEEVSLYYSEELLLTSCHVCNANGALIPCPNIDGCEGLIWFSDEEGSCVECGIKIDLQYVVNRYEPPIEKDTFEERSAWCGVCTPSMKSVIELNGDWVCLSCFERFDIGDMDHCEYCNELNAGVDLSTSYFTGCSGCDGKDPEKL